MKTRNVHWGGTTHCVDRLTSRKAQAALALAVSLWIANGGVASAEESVNSNTEINENQSSTVYKLTNDNGVTFTVKSGGDVKAIYSEKNGNTIIVESGGTVSGNKNGSSITGGVSNNTVTIETGATVTERVQGGYTASGAATGNTVIVRGTVNGLVSGGETDFSDGSASGNRVIVDGGTVKDGVYGGYSGTATGNTVELHNAAVTDGAVLGGRKLGSGGDQTTSNKLILSGANTVKLDVENFETIQFDSEKLAWTDGSTVLTARSFSNCGVLDVSAVTEKATTPGTMTLLQATGSNLPAFALSTGDEITAAGVKVVNEAKTDGAGGVTIGYNATHTVALANTNKAITYTVANSPVNKITLGEIAWSAGGTVFDGSAYDYTGVTNENIDTTNLKFTNPEDVTGTTTLLQANNTLTATLAGVAKDVSYSYAPVAGVTVSGTVNGTLATSGSNIQYTATANKASKLTFGSVAWTGGDETTPGTPLITRPANISFAGANVDTSNINFTNISELDANKQMTLVSGFDSNGSETFTGTKYKVGSTLQGEGKASLVGNDLIFTTDTRAEKMTAQEQTHNTVMGAEVGMAALAAGNDFIGAATEGLSLASNIGADGISSFAKMGGGSMRQETGSHIDVRTWNAILALGHANKKERGTFEYGAFFEYGRGNYTTYNGAERGDGSMHYTGGGLLAKWQKKDGLYVEGSLRAGSVHDDAHDVLRDVNGTPYSYETNAPYWGAHIGVGKIIDLGSDHELDVYGKFYHNHRKGVSFNAGGHYDLDAVNSDVLRIGARYTLKREKWNFYGGLAYEHELDGKASGTADGMKIRSADTSGASLRGELGVTFKPEKEGPLTLDFNVSGFAGKKRGVTGGVSVAWMF